MFPDTDMRTCVDCGVRFDANPADPEAIRCYVCRLKYSMKLSE